MAAAPMISISAASPTEAPALEIAERIRRGDWTPSEVLEAHIDRIAAVNGKINALVADRFEDARKEAKAAEQTLANAKDKTALPSLLGVPCTIKEFIQVDGMPNTAGLHARRDRVSREDATVVKRLREQGAIVMGVTNVPEGGMWVETFNNIYGRTSNPWDLSRTPGGSSGGEAALIACGATPFGIGSDIAGSVRVPSAFCGTVAHKPTGRRVPNTGHWGTNPHTGMFLVCGPMGRTVSDVAHVLSVIEGPDGQDPLTREFEAGAMGAVDLRHITAYPVRRVGRLVAGKSMRKAVSEARDVLSARGVHIERVGKSPVDNPFALWADSMGKAMTQHGASFYDYIGAGEKYHLWAELLRSMFGRSRFTFPALGLVALERIGDKLPIGKLRGPGIEETQAAVESLIGDNGVLIIPPYRVPAPKHRAAMMSPFDFLFCGIFSILEMPSTYVPTGFDEAGLPVGVQVVARRGNDHVALAVARAIEQDLGGWQPAPI